MPRKMPKEMEELLYKIDDPDTIVDIQRQWNELVAANENYERNYPQQYANLVEGNLKFKEQKSIQTPVEQMQMYDSIVEGRIHDHIEEKDNKEKEATYELGQDEQTSPDKGNATDHFRLTFSDMSEPKPDKAIPEKEKATNDIDKSQELNVTWLQAYKEERAREQQPETPEQQQPEAYTLQLNFGRLEELDRSGMEIEPDEPEMEKE